MVSEVAPISLIKRDSGGHICLLMREREIWAYGCSFLQQFQCGVLMEIMLRW